MPRLNIWILILAILSVILGIAGSFTIFFSLLSNNTQQSVAVPQIVTPIDSLSAFKTPLALIENKNPPSIITIPKEEPKKEIKANEPKPAIEPKLTKPAVVAEKVKEKPPVEVAKKLPVVAPVKEIEKPVPDEPTKELANTEEKIFDESELEQLVTRIKKAKQEYGIIPNCIQISTSKSGNNKRATSQVESYLRSRKFSIAGKEVTASKFSGVQIREGNDCLQVLIGSFY